MRRRDLFHALQCLQAALGLPGLGRLGPEPVDIGTDMGDFPLLFYVFSLLAGEMLRAQTLKGRIIAPVQGDALLIDVGNMAAHTVEKVPVMRDQQQGSRIGAQPVFQPDHRVQIQVVGGFIQQQQI